jgi:hypothetical protein
MITIKRWFNRKVNLGNYETADFGCEMTEEVEKDHDTASDLLHELCKKKVEQSISEFQSNILRDKLDSKIRLVKDEMEILVKDPEKNKAKISEAKFQLGLYEDELKALKEKNK